jgi:hypothetical protein
METKVTTFYLSALLSGQFNEGTPLIPFSLGVFCTTIELIWALHAGQPGLDISWLDVLTGRL